MSEPIQFLTQHGPMLIMGITALLLVGAMATAVLRSPVHRLRVCELSVLATLAWVVLACIPLPRLTWHTPNIPHASAIVPPASSSAPSTTPRVEIPPELIAKSQPNSKLIVSPPPPNITPTFNSTVDHSREIAAAFLIGAGACIAWLMLGHYLLWRMIRRSSAAPDHVTKMVTSQLGQKQRTPRVLIAPGLARPVTCGTLRPMILLPASLLRDDRQTQLRQVLLHELGHIQQGDGWGSLLFNLALPLLYFHPLYWILRRCAGLSRELVTDDWAARADGKETYVTQLISLARTRAAITLSPVGTIGILQTRSHFYRRMHMLLQRPQPLATQCSATCRAALVVTVLASIICSASILGVRPAIAQVGSTPAPANRASDSTEKRTDVAETLTARMNSMLLERQRIEADLANRRAAGAPPEEIANVQVLVETLQKEIDGLRQASFKLQFSRPGEIDI
jgi:beta-lactamase regulating signal transducer with metallopeptidase domain